MFLTGKKGGGMKNDSAEMTGSIFSEEDDAKDFLTYLQEANGSDLTDIERSGCVSEGRDLKDNRLIVMIPSLGLNKLDKPEVLFRKMLLLFIKKANEIVGNQYSVVYAHTNIDIMNQYPLIYKFYSVLPRSYKKNLLKMYIVHPNVGIKMFFEFSRVFLSQKFYNKLCLVESILDFQRIVPPTQLALPLKFLYKEDEERELKYCGTLASLSVSFDPALGTTKIIDVCTTFLKENNYYKNQGIFRIPGDEGELNLARVRLQYANIDGFTSSGRIEISANRRSIIIGDLDALYAKRASEEKVEPGYKKLSKQEMEIEDMPAEVPMSVVVISSWNTVGMILKMAIRDLPESLIPEDVYRDLIDMTRTYDKNNLSSEWDGVVAKRLAVLPVENISTFAHIVSFLREVAAESKSNNMDAHNLATVFGPTIFRSSMDDPIKAVMELKVSHTLLYNILIRENILRSAVRQFKEVYRAKHGADRNITDNPVFTSKNLNLSVDMNANGYNDLDAIQKSEIADITSSISPQMITRMFRGRENGGKLEPSCEEEKSVDGRDSNSSAIDLTDEIYDYLKDDEAARMEAKEKAMTHKDPPLEKAFEHSLEFENDD